MGQVSSSQRADFAQSNHNHNNNSISSLSLSRLSREQHNQQSSPRNVDHPFHRRHRSTGGIDSTVERSHASPLLTSRSAASPLPSVTTNPDIDMFRNSSDLDFHPSLRADSPVGTMERLGSHYSSSTLETTAAIPASATNRQSTMSRLGSRILPNAVVRGLLNSGEETPAEGRAHRIGLLSRTLHRSDSAHHSHRFSSLPGSSSRGISRRRSIRGPYPPPRGDAALLPDSPPNPIYLDSTAMARDSSSGRFSWRHRARLSHVRHSIAVPISQIFGQPPAISEPNQTTMLPPRRPSRPSFTEDSDHLLPPLGSMDTHMEFGGSRELDSVEPSTRNTLQMSTSTPSRPPRTSSPARRHTPSRSRHIRSIRRDEQTPLSRVLQMAAAAIAAQLSGNTPPAMPNIQAIGADGADGSLESFIQSLQQATSTQTQGIGTEDESGSNQRDGGLPHVNFLRVFRFVNPENTESNSTTGHPNQPGSEYTQDSGSDRMDLDDPTPTDNSQDRRLVTLVVVGVRSVPSISNGSDNDAGLHAHVSLDSLLRLPFISPNNVSRSELDSSGFLRRADRRSRFSSHRRSMGSNTFPANYDSQRHQRSHTSSRNQSNLANSLPTVLSESPPGPHPPPSTPADPGLSNVSSEANSPSRRPSASSVALPQLNEDSSQEPDESSENHHPLFNNVRQRRRSDSETARHRGLGSGAARRNGVVEPDSTSPSAGRSWLIYVVGTNLSENHPAFATPSLFTDNPTYEDMLLLSSLLGPAKPPVASQEDVASAGGIYRLVEYDGSLIAESADTTQKILITENERCLICLSEYEAAEEVRQLTKCHHLYHRECIDEWLTTGRNSCPLCRGQGVSNSESNDPGTTNEQETVS
ncbi:RING finger domain-containing protein [Histoplasma capsulatum G186AR]|uniref:RING finger domain-containing protein n=1 Tax=Ajellomyces capsulatus TaxID=5037 RepID=A0A8H8D1F0_AJECA|nr:RING finger domain-containing protein [Histoplasma capsulatum]QSS74326.1 RING finger domain-containing protein [Histoplasma capsulatum G186AR]